MIKVLHVVGKMHYGGMETLIMNIYRNTDRSKVQFDFLVHYKGTGEYDDEIKQLGGNIFVMPRAIPSNFFMLKDAYSNFFRIHHEYKFVHVHFRSIAFLIFLQAKKQGIHCIWHIHSCGIEHSTKECLRSIASKIAVQQADTIFACSRESGEYFVRGNKTFKVIKNGINAKKFYYDTNIRKKVREELGLKEQFVLICAARFAVVKNHEFLIDIVSELKKKDSNVCILLVGKGPLEDQIKLKVKQLSLENEVKFMGVRGDVNELMQAADCYVMPSLKEGLPVVCIEAQAAGLITFMSQETLSKEACITDLIKGISLNENAENWADKILSQKGYKRENQKSAIEKSGFVIDEIAKQMQDFYEGKTE